VKAPADIKLADKGAERVRQSHAEAIRELQSLPLASARIFTVSLASGKVTAIAHGLGRAPRMVLLSAPRGATAAGYINELRTDDRSQFVHLQANSFGATVEVEVMVL
jgi:hypothetical protein